MIYKDTIKGDWGSIRTPEGGLGIYRDTMRVIEGFSASRFRLLGLRVLGHRGLKN